MCAEGVRVKVAVVGGAGFIGSNLVDALVARGDEVIVVDDMSTGYRRNLNPAAPLHEVDISTDSEGLTSALHGREVVYLTAALARVPRSIEDPVGTHQVNVTGALRVYKAAVDAGVRRVVYSSSSSVYGDQPTLPLTEDMPPAPINPYACQKLMGEIYAQNFARIFGLETVCLRYFNVYGPRQVTEGAYRLVIGIFLDQRRRGEPLTIHGDGQQTRDFTWVGDVVRANILAAESHRVGKGEPINIGAGAEVSINRIAELIGGPVVHTPPRGFDERFKRAGIGRARDLLGWDPTVQIEEGIDRTRALTG
jgi:nucleoside-diphosphate-sugar epimerase